MRDAAQRAGLSLEEWAKAELCKRAPTAEQRKAVMAELMKHAGAVSVPDPTNADNEALDRDLAREYRR